MIRRPGLILGLLTGLNLLNYLDRMVISAVLPQIQEELELCNFVGGRLATARPSATWWAASSSIAGAGGARSSSPADRGSCSL